MDTSRTRTAASRVAFIGLTVLSQTAGAHEPRQDAPVALSLFFRDGAMPPVRLGDSSRFVEELDLTASVTTTTDQGIAPLAKTGDLAGLDWKGVAFVEEDWRQAGDGTFTRQRFFRGARWMDQPSHFVLFASNDAGWPLGSPVRLEAGADRKHGPEGDFFVRRFVARQITTGCAAVGDCAGAHSFTAQGLVLVREALHAQERARSIPAGATRLNLFWSADPHRLRSVALIGGQPPSPLGTGFQIDIEPLSPPASGVYQPGQAASFRIIFRDGQGHPLYPGGQLPTYADFLAGQIDTGLRYVDLGLNVTLYYALKKREGNLLVSLSGPTDRLKVPKATVGPAEVFAPQTTVASTPVDGFSAVAIGIPPLPVTFGGFSDPAIWQTPIGDTVNFTVPSDALPGTYVVAAKARREFEGEPINLTRTVSIQVGSAAPTPFSPTTGPCTSCHQGPSSLGNILHGLDDRRACYSCHAPLFFEPDNALDFRVHFVHSRSRRFPGDVNDCSLCHTTPPSGPARGFPGVP